MIVNNPYSIRPNIAELRKGFGSWRADHRAGKLECEQVVSPARYRPGSCGMTRTIERNLPPEAIIGKGFIELRETGRFSRTRVSRLKMPRRNNRELHRQARETQASAAAPARMVPSPYRSSGTVGITSMPLIVNETLRSPGQPLDASHPAFMEPRFGHDFSQVRVHSDTKAVESARAVERSGIYSRTRRCVRAGLYNPRSIEGRRLLAHELTHVVQQRHKESYESTKPRPELSTRQSRAGS